MNDFVPLFSQSNPTAAATLDASRLRFHPASSETPQPFHPINPPSAPAPAEHACAGSAAPEVTLQRNADRITQIRIKCGCGQVVVLDCEY